MTEKIIRSPQQLLTTIIVSLNQLIEQIQTEEKPKIKQEDILRQWKDLQTSTHYYRLLFDDKLKHHTCFYGRQQVAIVFNTMNIKTQAFEPQLKHWKRILIVNIHQKANWSCGYIAAQIPNRLRFYNIASLSQLTMENPSFEEELKPNIQLDSKPGRKPITDEEGHYLCRYEACGKAYSSTSARYAHEKQKHGKAFKAQKDVYDIDDLLLAPRFRD